MKKCLMGLICAVSFLTLASCATAPATTQGKTNIRQEADLALSNAKANDPSLVDVFSNAKGYAVFPSVGKGAIGIGGAYGKGVFYEDGVAVGYCTLSQATIGFQLGGQAYTEIILFENAPSVHNFKHGNFRFSAQATAVALKSGAGANAKYSNGIMVFTMNEAGLMYEASVGGQKFSYQSR